MPVHFPSIRDLPLPPAQPPTLTVVIDTEEEFDWGAPFDAQSTATRNIQEQGLAQEIFNRHGVVPTYVIDYPVAMSTEGQAVLKPLLEAGLCEIGAHLHPWVNPPHTTPVDNFHSFPGNLPRETEREKLSALVICIKERFGIKPTIYKAGRYGVGKATLATLGALGFEIDVSVVPTLDLSATEGPDFTDYPAGPYLMTNGILELPMSSGFTGRLASFGRRLYPIAAGSIGSRLRLPGILARTGLLERLRLSPEGHSLDDMRRLTRSALSANRRCMMLTYHSSSLLVGGSPYVRSAAELRDFLTKLDQYLSFFRSECGGRPIAISALARVLRGEAQSSPKGA